MGLWTFLDNAARQHSERTAIAIGTTPVATYSQLAGRAARVASGLLARHGLASGDRVVLVLRNRPEVLELFFACWHAGLIAVPVNAKLHAAEIAFIVGDCEAGLVIAEDDIAGPLAPLVSGAVVITPHSADYDTLVAAAPGEPMPVDADDCAWLFYTSGTTGQPKGAMLSHRNLMAMAIGYLADIDVLDSADNLLHIAATSHASGLFGLSFVAKAAGHVLPESGGFDEHELTELIAATPKLSFFVPPTLMRRMVADPGLSGMDHSNLRTILLGAAPVRVGDLTAGLDVFGPRFWNGYGQGETPCTISAMSKTMIAEAARRGDADQLGSVGVARTGIAVRIADDEGVTVPEGETGEILVRGETVMAGYWRRPDATARALRDGWLRTGDMGRMDGRGFLTLLDRKKDVIISGGSNIYAREVEDVLLMHPDVAEAAVIGVPNVDWGETVAAVIVPTVGAVPDAVALDAHCLAHLARFKRPRHVRLVESLPRNAAGKVLKRQLRETFNGLGQTE